MNERLKQFLEMENLTAAQFAEKLGLQRSGISHLLSGRNNPSYDFILKMMTQFPDLNVDWLILGKGKPYKNSPSNTSIAFEPDLFSDKDSVTSNLHQAEVPENPIFEQVIDNATQISDSRELKKENKTAYCSEEPVNIQPAPAKPTERKILKITVFYNDGTYEDR